MFRINTQVGAYTEFVLFKRPVAASTLVHSVVNKKHERDLAKDMVGGQVLSTDMRKQNTGRYVTTKNR